jgi:hypothetical protein
VKEFEPSPNFVTRVMAVVREEAHRREISVRWSAASLPKPVRCSVVFGAALITIANLLRLLLLFVAPSLCG